MNENKHNELVVKLLIVGNSAVGKTSLLLRYTEGRFSENHLPTIGIDFKIKKIHFDDISLKMQIWDTAGQERFKTVTQSYFKGTHGVIFVYSCTDRESYDHIVSWMKQANSSAPQNSSKILVANKCDADEKARVVTTEEGRELASQFKLHFFETSAKTNENISEAFQCIAKMIKDEIAPKALKEAKIHEPDRVLNLQKDTQEKEKEESGSRCC